MSEPNDAEALTGIDIDTAARILTQAKRGCERFADHPEMWPGVCGVAWEVALECGLIDEHQYERGMLYAERRAGVLAVTLGWKVDPPVETMQLRISALDDERKD
jgi:hypothetical protein